ncbi:hypothetical protein SDC9_147759 [bioreactor metagenome]|uniref:Uncharacterized protein n=1 Tax=bioreactor metagenome TaxID=1076179 RepID=A0A645EJ07_9ZZZZ
MKKSMSMLDYKDKRVRKGCYKQNNTQMRRYYAKNVPCNFGTLLLETPLE